MAEDKLTVKGTGEIFVELTRTVATRGKVGVKSSIKRAPVAMRSLTGKNKKSADKQERLKKSKLKSAAKTMKTLSIASRLIKTAARVMSGKPVIEDREAKCQKARFIAETLREYIIEQVDNHKIQMKRNTPFKKLVMGNSATPYAGSDFWEFLRIDRQLNCTHVLYWSDESFRKTTPETIVKMFDGKGFVESPTDSEDTKRRAKWFWTNVFKAMPATTRAERKRVFERIKNKDGRSGQFTSAKRRFFSGPVKRFARRYEKDNSVSIFYDETSQRVTVSVR